MPRPKRWETTKQKDGIWTVQLSSWTSFHDYITQIMLDYSHYVWRGDRLGKRPLLPTFDRNYPIAKRETIEKHLIEHLRIFKESTRGRRGYSPSVLVEDNDWWALGQHHGLDTPLLDWTHSPFVALFFAFEKVNKHRTRNRSVYAINPAMCEWMNEKIRKEHTGENRADIAEFFSPQQDENSRLVNQSGLFSRCTAGIPLEEWVAYYFYGVKNQGVLLHILIPDKGRQECLRTLNKMNINYLTLFPDLQGASRHANTVNSISEY